MHERVVTESWLSVAPRDRVTGPGGWSKLSKEPDMADDKTPPDTARAREQDNPTTDRAAAYAHTQVESMDHVRDCASCRTRGIDCFAVGPIKKRLRETRETGVAGQAALR